MTVFGNPYDPRSSEDPVRRGESELLRAAEHELEEVQRQEVAALLRGAAALRGARLRSRILALHPFRPASVPAWRAGARRELELLDPLASRADRDLRVVPAERAFGPSERDADAFELLARLAETPLSAWPAPATLARTALELRADEAGRVALGFAHLAEGDAHRAVALFTRLLSAAPPPRLRGSILEGLAAAEVVLGRPHLALGAFDQAADDPGSSLVALVSSLYFALRLGDTVRARRAAARLDLLVDPTAARFLAAIAHLCRWVARSGAELAPRASESSAELLRLLLRSPHSPAGKVCHALG